MVWWAYLALSGSILFAITCAALIIGAPPKILIEWAISLSALMLAGAMLANLCAVALRRSRE